MVQKFLPSTMHRTPSTVLYSLRNDLAGLTTAALSD